MAKSVQNAQDVVDALTEARNLTSLLAQALRKADAAIAADGTKDNGAETRAAVGATSLVQGAVIRELSAWEGYLQARSRN